jgi:shikimate kinase
VHGRRAGPPLGVTPATGGGARNTVRSDKLYLIGFMGAGKTTLARRLGRRLRWQVEDLDERIEARERRTVAEIFRDSGEPYFRAVERQALAAILPVRHAVVATGGGTFVDAENRTAMLADGTVLWLDLPFASVLERVPTDGRRPLAADRSALEDLYRARRVAYQQAHVRIEATAARPDALVEQVLDRLGW